MKFISRGVVCASLLLTLSAAAQSSGPASNGDFQFALQGATGAIRYDARLHGTTAQGQMTFTATSEVSNEDVDGEGTTSSAITGLSVTVSFDCLRINGNRAAMSGLVTSSTVPGFVGVRAILAVEDNGEGKKEGRDRFTWGVYRNNARNWTPSDAEVPGDNGAFLTWYATDAERTDDVAVLQNGAPTSGVDCKSFPPGSYAFEELAHGAGNIQVKP